MKTSDSNLAEKLGFCVEDRDGYIHVRVPEEFWVKNDKAIQLCGFEKVGLLALWNLCLELSERANCKHEGIVITAEVSYCPACANQYHSGHRVISVNVATEREGGSQS